MSEALHTKYRPASFDDVIGHASIVDALEQVIAKGTARSFLFSGPSGTGKTTLARIAAREAGCSDETILEIDAATHTGIDAMRQIQEVVRYKPFGTSDKRAVILDECHGLSRQSWESLLKVVEEPPEHALWFFCTTQPAKVPTTIRTRCASFNLKPLSEGLISKLVDHVAKKEKMKIADSVFDLVVKEAMGSPRQALVNLALCAEARDKKEAAELLRVALESDPIIALCRFIVQGRGSWIKAMQLVEDIGDEAPESVRIVVVNYLASALKAAKTDREATAVLTILDAFAVSYNQSEGMAPLFLSVGRALFSQNR